MNVKIKGQEKQEILPDISNTVRERHTNHTRSHKRADETTAAAQSVVISRGHIGVQDTKSSHAYDSSAKYREEGLKGTAAKQKAEKDISAVTGDDCYALEEEGKSAGEYNSESFEKRLERIKEQRDIKRQTAENMTQREQEREQALQRTAVALAADGAGVSADIITELLQVNGLAATPAIVEQMRNAFDTLEQSLGEIDVVKAWLVEKGEVPSIENIFEGAFSGKSVVGSEGVTDDLWAGLEKQITDIVQGMDGDGTSVQQRLEQAKWLLANDLPVTAESISLAESVDAIQEPGGMEEVLQTMLDAVAYGENPVEVSLDHRSWTEAKEAVSGFHEVTGQAVEGAVAQQKEAGAPIDEITLRQLLEAEESSDAVIDIDTVTVRRQLEEIRLHMSVRAAVALADSGIDIETTGITKVVESLRQLEREYYEGILSRPGQEVSNREIDIVAEVDRATESLRKAPIYALGETFNQRLEVTLAKAEEQGSVYQARLDRAGEAYETMMTKPRSDLGDSLGKAFGNMGSLMQELGIEETAANQRAVRILAYNQMEISVESVENMKVYDAQVRCLIDNLQPETTLELIRQGNNPLDTPIVQVSAVIQQMQAENDALSGERYSKFLWKLEKDNAITKEERKGYIGMYRLLNQIEKSDGAAIGAVAKQGLPLTLSNLLTAIRSRKDRGMDVQVDDDTSQHVRVKQGESITDQIHAGFGYEKQLVSEILDTVTPRQLQKISEGNPEELLAYTPERLQETLSGMESSEASSEPDMSYFQQQAEKLRDAFRENPDLVAFLEEQQIYASADTIMAAKNILGKMRWYNRLYENVEDVPADLVESLDNPDFEETYDAAMAQVEKDAGNRRDIYNMDVDSYREWLSFTQGIRLGRKLAGQGRFDIPVQTEDGIVDVNLTLIRNGEEKGRVRIETDTAEFGHLQMEFKVSGKGISGLLLSDSREGADNLNRVTENLTEAFSEIGVATKHLSVCVEGRRGIPDLEISEGETENKTLYQIAKAAIKTIL